MCSSRYTLGVINYYLEKKKKDIVGQLPKGKQHEEVATHPQSTSPRRNTSNKPLKRESHPQQLKDVLVSRRVPFTGIQSLQQSLQEEEHSYHHQVSKTSKHLQ
jgi:hypothetical protein